MASSATAVPSAAIEEQSLGKHRTLLQDATRRFFHNRLAIFGLVLVVIFVILAIFAEVLAPHPFDKVYFDRVLQFPLEHPEHLLGTDNVRPHVRIGKVCKLEGRCHLSSSRLSPGSASIMRTSRASSPCS